MLKKASSANGDCFLSKGKISSLKEKVEIIGKSELEISALVHRTVGVDFSVDLSVYLGSKNLAICRLCYNMLNAYNKALSRLSMVSRKNLKITDLSISKDYR